MIYLYIVTNINRSSVMYNIIVRHVFEHLKAVGLIQSTDAYSREFLGRHRGYYRHLIAQGLQPSASVLVILARRLDEHQQTDMARTVREVLLATEIDHAE
jgi:hypothetical protein